jgi:tellurite resistance protein TerC
MFSKEENDVHPEKNFVFRIFRKIFPVTENYEGDRFFVKKINKYFATPLFLVVVVIETTDIVFAVDSIPAILGITWDPFIVYTSNVFAILGLRALYFALAGIMKMFYYLHYGLSVILIFIGGKMLIADFYKMPVSIALGVVALVLALSVLFSVYRKNSKDGQTISG